MNRKNMTLVCALLFAGGMAQAFTGTLSYASHKNRVDHTLVLSNWREDAAGVPSFDYTYEHHGAGCQLRLSGRAVADSEDGDRHELIVFNPTDDRNRETGQVVTYNGGEASLTAPYKAGAPGEIGLMAILSPQQRAHSCDKGEKIEGLGFRMDAGFQKPQGAAEDRVSRVLLSPGGALDAARVGFSQPGGRMCVAGIATGDKDKLRLLLVDRARQSVLWDTTVPVPAQVASLRPQQCAVDGERVYLLALGETTADPHTAETRTFVSAYDRRGKQILSVPIQIRDPGRHGAGSESGYAMRLFDGVEVVGATRDRDPGAAGNPERYGTWTQKLDWNLHPVGAPVYRKNGAYVFPLAARMVDQEGTLYVAGLFRKGATTRDEPPARAASRLIIGGGYTWSTPLTDAGLADAHYAIGEDGASYALGYEAGKTTVQIVRPNGKALPPRAYASSYCATRSMAALRTGLLAVRAPCGGKGNVLVAIDAATAAERRLGVLAGEPLSVATYGDSWAVLARDAAGTLTLYSADAGAP